MKALCLWFYGISIRDKSYIKPEMVTKIKKIAEELNYKPWYNLHT